MDNWFLQENSHLENALRFDATDPDLLRLKEHTLIYEFSLLDQLPINNPGVFTLCGAHQTGKTTLLKNWIQRLLREQVSPSAIAFFAGRFIADYHELQRLLKKQLSVMPANAACYIIIDDITDIRDFAKALKSFKDLPQFSSVTWLLSGSDNMLKETEAKQHFYLYSLSFRETLLLKQRDAEPNLSSLYKGFQEYLLHGGNLVAINDYAKLGEIQDKTLLEYGEWVSRETTSHGKQERFLREIVKTIFKYHDQQITWNALASELSIDHPKTIGDYFSWLEALGIIFIQYALLEDKLTAAPKKARKIIFTDPFYYHAMTAWLRADKKNCASHIKVYLDNPEVNSYLVKSCVIAEFLRYYPTYYIKAEGEVGLAYVNKDRFWPIEITWSAQLRAKDLKQILKYANGRILTKTDRSGVIQHIQTEPLPLALWQLEDSNIQ